eukprot:TRINITY_DN3392_c0_g2_i3.p1 TRINITY_DN3392_c0_g2~~TRINITY_DN3392_c0_g2_i3.p1  ORF type:complete len:184 (-),score=2.12 TRINITY_DN3392_c0_g2_i3:70-621(-)
MPNMVLPFPNTIKYKSIYYVLPMRVFSILFLLLAVVGLIIAFYSASEYAGLRPNVLVVYVILVILSLLSFVCLILSLFLPRSYIALSSGSLILGLLVMIAGFNLSTTFYALRGLDTTCADSPCKGYAALSQTGWILVAVAEILCMVLSGIEVRRYFATRHMQDEELEFERMGFAPDELDLEYY